jgi:hypothetical protein
VIRLSTPVAALAVVAATIVVTFGVIKLADAMDDAAPPANGARVSRDAATPTRFSHTLGTTPSPTRTALPPVAREIPSATPSVATLPPLPQGWPQTLELGVADGLGGAAAMQAGPPYRFRYQYLAGGSGTGNGWTSWEPDGAFVSTYTAESARYGITPVFTYYMALQSAPNAGVGGGLANLQDVQAMRAYYTDLKLFFERAGASPATTVVLHVEPDLWGFLQQGAPSADGSSVRVQVGETGADGVAGLPDTGAGFAQAFVRLRDLYAPNVVLAYHLSIWGTGTDLTYTDASPARVDALADLAATFYDSLAAPFDLVFAEFSDRDAGFKEAVYHDGGASWWDETDFERNVQFLARFVQKTQKRVVMWQIPLGNTKMRAMDNTHNHYQDNRVEWLLGDASRAHLDQYRRAGVIALLFGRGADGATCSCDANNDGITNPPPINGNSVESLSDADDGGFFHQRAGAYYAAGPVSLVEH